MSDIANLLEQTEENMMEVIGAMERDFAVYRTGKASTSLVENIMVEHYGTTMRLRDMAGISTPEPRLIVVQPWDKSALQPIEKAIQAAKIGIMPLNDGRMLRLPIPELSEERRRDLSKQVAKRAEEAKIALRNVRRDANETVKKDGKTGGLTEDQSRDLLDGVQKLTDDYIKQIETTTEKKTEEILKV